VKPKEIAVTSDPNGLPSLLNKHGAELHALFTRLTLRAGAAEDLLQDLFLKLQRSDGFAKAENRKAYLFRAAMHLAFDWRKTQRETVPLPGDTSANAESPLDGLIEAEELEQVLDAMRQLSDLGRQALVLHYLQHQDYGKIAQEMGKTEHQVRGLCHKAIGQLQAILRPAANKPNK
jgi:RNA polymerase sigma factor (sigma-70 family)